MDCGLYTASGYFSVKHYGGVQFMSQVGGYSHESEHDLGVMVSDFLENGSGGDDSWYSSDSDSGFSDLGSVNDKILFQGRTVDHYENDLLSVVNSLMLSMKETDLHPVNSATCNASCVRFSLVKLLRICGYDATVSSSRWPNSGKIPGGDHEYIEVENMYESNGNLERERFIVDIDFRSHFEIARAVDSYNRILNSLPVVFAGNLSKLHQYLKLMVDAARSSLKQNSMPLPPWRSLAYLHSKWESPHKRILFYEEMGPYAEGPISPRSRSLRCGSPVGESHKQCWAHLRRLQYWLQSEFKVLKPANTDITNNTIRLLKFQRQRQSSFRNL